MDWFGAERHMTSNGMAVRNIRHRGLRRLWERNDHRGVAAQSADKLTRMMAALNRTSAPEKLAARLAAASTCWQPCGVWSLTVTGKWRLIFRFERGDALDLDLVDYH